MQMATITSTKAPEPQFTSSSTPVWRFAMITASQPASSASWAFSPGKHASSGALGSPDGPRWSTMMVSSPGSSMSRYPGMSSGLGRGSESGHPYPPYTTGPLSVRSSRSAGAPPPPATTSAGYTPAFGPLVISRSVARYGSKSSSVPMTKRLSIVNSAWWALPSGVSAVPNDSSSSGSTAG